MNQKIVAAVIIVVAGAGLVAWYMTSQPPVVSTQSPTEMQVAVPSPCHFVAVSPYRPELNNLTAPKVSKSTLPKKNDMHLITISTNCGEIQFETFDADAPNTVANFVTLANKKFYDGVIFHRVIKGFMIQGGDPNGTGTGGPDYKFADELNPKTASYKNGYKQGVVAMANAGPNTNGSQFFIMHQDYPLPNNYTIFGHVVKGQEIVDAIANVPVDSNDKPLEPVVMQTVTVSEVK